MQSISLFFFLIISLDFVIGSFTGVVVSQLLPALLHFKVIGTRGGVWRAVEDWVIVILFFGVMIICTYSAVVSMIKNFFIVSFYYYHFYSCRQFPEEFMICFVLR